MRLYNLAIVVLTLNALTGSAVTQHVYKYPKREIICKEIGKDPYTFILNTNNEYVEFYFVNQEETIKVRKGLYSMVFDELTISDKNFIYSNNRIMYEGLKCIDVNDDSIINGIDALSLISSSEKRKE